MSGASAWLSQPHANFAGENLVEEGADDVFNVRFESVVGQGHGDVVCLWDVRIGLKAEQIGWTPGIPQVTQVRQWGQRALRRGGLHKQIQAGKQAELTGGGPPEVHPQVLQVGLGGREGAEGVVHDLPAHAVRENDNGFPSLLFNRLQLLEVPQHPRWNWAGFLRRAAFQQVVQNVAHEVRQEALQWPAQVLHALHQVNVNVLPQLREQRPGLQRMTFRPFLVQVRFRGFLQRGPLPLGGQVQPALPQIAVVRGLPHGLNQLRPSLHGRDWAQCILQCVGQCSGRQLGRG